MKLPHSVFHTSHKKKTSYFSLSYIIIKIMINVIVFNQIEVIAGKILLKFMRAVLILYIYDDILRLYKIACKSYTYVVSPLNPIIKYIQYFLIRF